MIEEIEKDSHALKPFFDVTLCDENDQPLSWTKGLVKSVTYPTFSFVVGDHDSGTTRGYDGWNLPDALSLTLYETRKRELEKYLLDWAFGEKGIFDLKSGCFRAVEKESYLYRQINFRTTYFDTSLQSKMNHTALDVSKVVKYTLENVMSTVTERSVSLEEREFISKMSDEFSKNVLQQHVTEREIVPIFEKQQIPVLDKLTKTADMVVGQLINRVPLLKSVVTPVVIPPPLMKVPTNLNLNAKSIVSEALNFTKRASVKGSTGFESLKAFSLGKNSFKDGTNSKTINNVLNLTEAQQALKTGAQRIDQIINSLPSAKSEEKTTSSSTYKVALQSYSVDQYDYSDGGAVSFSLNLPLTDYLKPEIN